MIMMTLLVIMRMTKMVITSLITQVLKRAGGNGSQTYHVVFILTLAPTILRWDVDEGDFGVDTGQVLYLTYFCKQVRCGICLMLMIPLYSLSAVMIMIDLVVMLMMAITGTI